LFETQITGITPYKELDCIAANIYSGHILNADQSDELMWILMQEGKSVPAGERESVPLSADLLDSIEDHAIARLNQRYEERYSLNSALADTRLLALSDSFERNLRVREERLETTQLRR